MRIFVLQDSVILNDGISGRYKAYAYATKTGNCSAVEIIGEAANRLPEDFRERYPAIEWNRIRGLRNRIVHDYFGIDYYIV